MGKRVSGNILVERKICRKNENGHVCHFHSMSLLCWHFSNHFCLVFCTIACVRARCVPITKGSPHWRICFCATISRTISTIRPISWSQKQRFRRVLQTMNGHDTCSILVNMCIADYINIWFHSAYKVIFVFTCTLYARKGNLNICSLVDQISWLVFVCSILYKHLLIHVYFCIIFNVLVPVS